jgi:hypothetical protein
MVSCSIIRFKSHFFFLSLSLFLSLTNTHTHTHTHTHSHTHTLTHFISPSLLHPLKTSKSTHTPNLKKLSVNSSQHASTISFYLSFAHTHTHTRTHTHALSRIFSSHFCHSFRTPCFANSLSLSSKSEKVKKEEKKIVWHQTLLKAFFNDATLPHKQPGTTSCKQVFLTISSEEIKERERERLRGVLFLHLSFEHFRSALEILGGFGSHTHTKISHTLPPFRWASTKKLLLFAMPCLPARSTRERERK